MEFSQNHATLRGVAAAEPVYSHTNHGQTYLTFPLSVRRLSGTMDTLNVVASSALLSAHPVAPGDAVEIGGEVRSFNNRSGPGSRLVITLYARDIAPAQGEPENALELEGVLCKQPVVRRTPLGREICDLLLAVNRRYGRADYLPCIAWGSLARQCGDLDVGDTVHIGGRLQSRKYHKVENGREEERTAFEVSVMSLESA